MADDGNIMFVVCLPCQQAHEKDFGLKLAGRTRRSWYGLLAPVKTIEGWFQKHSKCGGRTGPDHFALAHSYERNYDQTDLKASVQEALRH